MGCYCQEYSKENGLKSTITLTFDEFIQGSDQKSNLCSEWVTNIAVEQGMIIGSSVMVTVINLLATSLFNVMVTFERKHTINEETETLFMKKTLIQYINIALIILAVNFKFLDEDFLGFVPIFNGTYPDFTAEWYKNVGKTLSLTLMINIFSPHVSYLVTPLIKIFFRFKDRSFKNKDSL